MEDNSSTDANVALTITTILLGDDWVIDFGCSYHVTDHKHWFTTYQYMEGSKVLMGNDSPYEVIRIGKV